MKKLVYSNSLALLSLALVSIAIARTASQQGQQVGIQYFVRIRMELLTEILTGILAVVLISLPGIIFAPILDNGRRDFRTVLVRAWAISLAVFTIFPFVFTFLTGITFLTSGTIVLSFAASALGFLVIRKRQLTLSWIATENRFEIAVGAALPVLVLFLFGPKFFSEELNGDGTHLYVSAKSFISSLVPASPTAQGTPELYPLAIIGEIFNAALYLRIFPESPNAIRLPFVWGLAFVVPLLISMIKTRKGTRIGPASKAAIITAILTYVILLAYQTSYNPYFADLGLPGAREPFVVLGFLGFVHFFRKRDVLWGVAFLTITCVSTPAAPILIAAYLAAFALLQRSINRNWVFGYFAVLVLVQLGLQLLPQTIGSFAGTNHMKEFGTTGIAPRIRFLTFQSPERLLYWVVPCGILPGFSLLLWKKMDDLSKELQLVIWAYTLFFIFQAYRVLPHHFAPIVLLSLVVFWRTVVNEKSIHWIAIPGLGGSVIALAVSFPATWDIHTTGHQLASRFAWHPEFASMTYREKLEIGSSPLC